jgi:4'-phosphopantetheinyl transferase
MDTSALYFISRKRAADLRPLMPMRLRLWTADTRALPPSALQSALAWLDDADRKRAARFVHAADRESFSVAHALLHWALAFHGDVPRSNHRFVRGTYNRPRLDPALVGPDAPHFNLAHARGLVAVVVASANVCVGIDVEQVVPRGMDVMRITRQVFAPAEADWITKGTSSEECWDRFVRIWTIKEALLKATGRGLSVVLKQFVVIAEPPGLQVGLPELAPRGCWRMESWQPVPGAWAALAVDEPREYSIPVERAHLTIGHWAALLAATVPRRGGE